MADAHRTQPLQRSMRVIGALLLTLSVITPASSVFIIVPGVIAQAGTGAFLSMAAAAVLSVPIAYVYAELSSAFPIAGGEYCMLGRTTGRGAGFVILGLTAFSNILQPAVLALGASTYIAMLAPGLDPTGVAIALIAVTTLLSILHIRTNAWVTGIFLMLELLALAVVVALALAHVHRPIAALAAHPVWLAGGALTPTPLAMIGLATSVSIFAYNGFGSAIYFAEEMHDAGKLVARAIFWALLITVITELVPVTAVLMGAPDLKSLLAAANPFGDFVTATGGHFLSAAISTGIALAILNAVLATILQNARLLYSTGRDRAWHPRINQGLTAIHPRFQSPWIASLAAGGASILMCFLGLDLILVLTGTGIAFIYAAVCCAAIAGRRSGTTAHAAYRMPLYPFWPIVGLIALAYVFYTSALDPSSGRPSLIANGAVMAVSLIYYLVILRRKGDWILRAPDSAV